MYFDTFNLIYDRKCDLFGYKCGDKNIKGHVNMRAYPGANADVICCTKRNVNYDIIGMDYRFYRIKLSEYRECWVSSTYMRIVR